MFRQLSAGSSPYCAAVGATTDAAAVPASADAAAAAPSDEALFAEATESLSRHPIELVFIAFSDRTIFKNELFLYNYSNYQFIKTTNNLTPLPTNHNERLCHSYFQINGLISIVYSKDLNRCGYQNSGVGPRSLAAFEGGLKAYIKGSYESYQRWLSNTPTLAVIDNAPLLLGHSSLCFRFLSNI